MLSDKIPEVTAKDVVQTVLVGFKEGEAKVGSALRQNGKWLPKWKYNQLT